MCRGGLEHEVVPSSHACARDAQLPKCISRQPIHARLIQDEIRIERTAEVDRLGHCLDVANVRCPGFQGEVMVAHGLPEREVGPAVDRDREDPILIGEDRCCPVPLVDVEVQDLARRAPRCSMA